MHFEISCILDTLYSSSKCITARYFRVGRCLIWHCLPQDRGSPEKTQKVYFIIFPNSLPLAPFPPSPPPSLPLTTVGVTSLLKLPVGVGRSGGCLQNTMVRMPLVTVNYEKQCEDNTSTVTCNESISYVSYQEVMNRFVALISSILIIFHQPSSTTGGSLAKEPLVAI